MTRKTPAKSRKFPKLPARKAVARRTPRKVDFDDEDAVLKEVCKELDLDPSECEIRNTSAPNGCGTAYTITVGRNTEYIVIKNEEDFEAAAREGVENDLRDEPGNFNADFIQSHIDLDKLRDALHSDVSDSLLDSLTQEANRHPMEFLKEHDIDIPPLGEDQIRKYCNEMEDSDLLPWTDERLSASQISEYLSTLTPEEQWDTIGQEPDAEQIADISSIADDLATAQLQDPLEYLVDIYGRLDAPKKAIEIAGINIEAAADEAISADGAAHFMCNYDGNYNTTKSGFIVWRHN